MLLCICQGNLKIIKKKGIPSFADLGTTPVNEISTDLYSELNPISWT